MWPVAIMAPLPILAAAPEMSDWFVARCAFAAYFLGNMAVWPAESFAVPLWQLVLLHAAGAAMFALLVILHSEAARRFIGALAALVYPILTAAAWHAIATISPHGTLGRAGVLAIVISTRDADDCRHRARGRYFPDGLGAGGACGRVVSAAMAHAVDGCRDRSARCICDRIRSGWPQAHGQRQRSGNPGRNGCNRSDARSCRRDRSRRRGSGARDLRPDGAEACRCGRASDRVAREARRRAPEVRERSDLRLRADGGDESRLAYRGTQPTRARPQTKSRSGYFAVGRACGALFQASSRPRSRTWLCAGDRI